MDNLCVQSLTHEEHIVHLIKVFEKCRTYQIYHNPKKCVFMVGEGRILGHIVSKSGVLFNVKRINVIVNLP